jgi:hypothetical protein
MICLQCKKVVIIISINVINSNFLINNYTIFSFICDKYSFQ